MDTHDSLQLYTQMLLLKSDLIKCAAKLRSVFQFLFHFSMSQFLAPCHNFQNGWRLL